MVALKIICGTITRSFKFFAKKYRVNQVLTQSGTIQPEILAGIKYGGWALNFHCKSIGGFKFGSLVRDLHTYNIIWKYQILADFNLAVAS